MEDWEIVSDRVKSPSPSSPLIEKSLELPDLNVNSLGNIPLHKINTTSDKWSSGSEDSEYSYETNLETNEDTEDQVIDNEDNYNVNYKTFTQKNQYEPKVENNTCIYIGIGLTIFLIIGIYKYALIKL